MGLRRADLRFVLPRHARSAVVLGGLDGWSEGLGLAGVELVDPRSDRVPDVAVASARLAKAALASRAEQIILEGRSGARTLEATGLHVGRYLALPRTDAPNVILPLQRGTPVVRYALERWRPAYNPIKHLRNRAAAALIRSGTLPPLRPWQVIASRSSGPPFLIAAAASVDVPKDSSWFMAPGTGDPLARALFHLFPPGADAPAWVLKFARVVDYSEPFDRDERGLRVAAEAGGAVAAHAPRLLGRVEVDGLHASIESAALGELLARRLRRRPRASSSLEAIEAIAAWILRLGRETASPPAALTDERRRIAQEVLPQWISRGAPPNLIDRLPELPAVLQHNDVGTWNIVLADPADFIVIDWESARRHGLPLWDLLYFLADALPHLDGANSFEERAAGSIALLRGDAPSSHILFKWLRRAVEELGIPPDAVGTIATLAWLHHGLSHVARAEAVERVEPGSAIVDPVARIAPAWLGDPALGPAWNRWRV